MRVNNLAYSLLQADRLKEAITAVVTSLTLAPDRASSWSTYGILLAKQREETGAVGAFLNAYRFSKNQEKTKEYLQKLVAEDGSQEVKEAAIETLAKIGGLVITPLANTVVESSPPPTSSADQRRLPYVEPKKSIQAQESQQSIPATLPPQRRGPATLPYGPVPQKSLPARL